MYPSYSLLSKKNRDKNVTVFDAFYLIEKTAFKNPFKHFGLFKTTIFKFVPSYQHLETKKPASTINTATAKIINFSGKQQPINNPIPNEQIR